MCPSIIGLGREAVIADPASRADWWMNCFFFSKHSQSRLAYNNVVSLPKLIQEYGDKPLDLRDKVRESLRSFFEKAFTRADVEVTIENASGGYTLAINVNVSDYESVHKETVNVGYALTYKDSVLRSILETNGNRILYEFPN